MRGSWFVKRLRSPRVPMNSRAHKMVTRWRARRRTKKAALEAPLLKLSILKTLRRFGGLFLHRAGIQTLGIDIAVDEFDHGHRRVVAVAEAGLDDAGVAALAVLVAGRQHVEQLADLILVAPPGDRLTAHGQPPLLAEGNQ